MHGAFSKKVPQKEKVPRKEKPPRLPPPNRRNPNRCFLQFQEKAEVIEFKEDRFEHNRGEEDEVIEEVVDVKADGFTIEEVVGVKPAGFIQQKHRGFEQCKWNTFKAI